MNENSQTVAESCYGEGDTSYQTAGGLEGITHLVNRFYDLMDRRPEAKILRDMHAQDLSQSGEKLIAFLSVWFGGPALFSERYGNISLPMSHSHLSIDMATKESWLNCMSQAMQDTGLPQGFREHALKQFAVPAESMRLMSEFKQNQDSQGNELYDPA